MLLTSEGWGGGGNRTDTQHKIESVHHPVILFYFIYFCNCDEYATNDIQPTTRNNSHDESQMNLNESSMA